MNTIILTGNLGADPESFFTPEGTHIVSFPFAFRSSKDKTSWIKITVFNKTAEVAAQYLHKGAKIAVSGILDQDKWETDEGQTRSAMKLIVNSIEFIKTDGRGFEEDGNQDDQDNDIPI